LTDEEDNRTIVEMGEAPSTVAGLTDEEDNRTIVEMLSDGDSDVQVSVGCSISHHTEEVLPVNTTGGYKVKELHPVNTVDGKKVSDKDVGNDNTKADYYKYAYTDTTPEKAYQASGMPKWIAAETKRFGFGEAVSRAKAAFRNLPNDAYKEDRPDKFLDMVASRPTRVRLSGRPRALPPTWTYIGRGSQKFGVPPSVWGNPFVVGRDGDRVTCVKAYYELLLRSPPLLERLPELRGQVLACHCGPSEECHADALIRAFTEKCEPDLADEDATSDEDEHGRTKAKRGDGWLGRGASIHTGMGHRGRTLRDGGGLCSPGRWPPSRRRLPRAGAEVAGILHEILDGAAQTHGEKFEEKLVCALACGKVEEDPLNGLDKIAKKKLEDCLARDSFVRDDACLHPGHVIDFELVAALARKCQDPDAEGMVDYRAGIRLGHLRRMPRTPAVCERKARWSKHVGNDTEHGGWSHNYNSAAAITDKVEATFEEQEACGMMLAVKYKEAKKTYGERLRVASLGAVGPDGDERIIHDGTHGVGVNGCIRVRDQDETPLHGDLRTVLDAVCAESDSPLFALCFDVSKANRRVPVHPLDWGLQACSTLDSNTDPDDDTTVWLNTVGTYGVGSASYHWNRVGSLLVRLLLYVVSEAGLKWALRFAGDYFLLGDVRAITRPLAMVVLLVRALGIPLKWCKFRGGLRVERVGYFVDLVGKEIGISDRRCEWAAAWCRKTAEGSTVSGRRFAEALGRLAFAAGPLEFVRPFLGPLYGWSAVVSEQSTASIPPMVKQVLLWIADQFDRKERVAFGVPVRRLGELLQVGCEGRRADHRYRGLGVERPGQPAGGTVVFGDAGPRHDPVGVHTGRSVSSNRLVGVAGYPPLCLGLPARCGPACFGAHFVLGFG
jgi:hypothetical protein